MTFTDIPALTADSRQHRAFIRNTPNRTNRRTFGAGTRKCLGDQFALLEAHIILMEFARSVRPRPVAATLPRAEPRATYRPSGGVPATIVGNSTVT